MHLEHRTQIAGLRVRDRLVGFHQFRVLGHLLQFIEERAHALLGKEALEPQKAVALVVRQSYFVQGAFPACLVAGVDHRVQSGEAVMMLVMPRREKIFTGHVVLLRESIFEGTATT